jgi:hypothetical protein
VFQVAEGDGEAYRYRVEYSECAVCKSMEAQGAAAVLPYCSVFDFTAPNAFNAGMVVESTIGGGGEKCVASFHYGRETPLPEWMQRFDDSAGI